MSEVDMKRTDMTGRVDFSTFHLTNIKEDPDQLWTFGNQAIIKLAAQFGMPVEEISVEYLFNLVRMVGANKELQLNITAAQRELGNQAYVIASDILDGSGILKSLNRSFVDPWRPVPDECNLVITGGVAGWMLRRSAVASRIDSVTHPNVYVAAGTRRMCITEHQRVHTLKDLLGYDPSEQEFAEHFLQTSLALDAFNVVLVPVESTNGNNVLSGLFAAHPALLESRIMVIGNAPSAIQSAAQLRIVARGINPNFDSDGTQLFVRSDACPLLPEGADPADGQHPISGLGALARAAKLLLEAALS